MKLVAEAVNSERTRPKTRRYRLGGVGRSMADSVKGIRENPSRVCECKKLTCLIRDKSIVPKPLIYIYI
jgi:hypothetical protein